MWELVGGDKILPPLNSEHALSLSYLPTKDNSSFDEYEFYSQCFQHLKQKYKFLDILFDKNHLL